MSSRAKRDRIAFIGLGMMGYPLAGHLAAAGFPLAVFDLNPVALRKCGGNFPCRICSTALEAVKDSDVVITMLPGSHDVVSVVLGSESSPGIVSALDPDSVVIDMSSSDPLRTRELAETLSENRITLVDAPVSGGVKKAQEGTIAIMFGGSSVSLKRCRNILESLSSTIFHTGPVGSGHAMKALNNYVSAAGLLAVVEALHTGEEFGLDPAVMTQVLNASTGRNNTTENKVSQFMLSETFNSGFSLQLMAKDIGIAMHLAEQLQIPTPLGRACDEIWRTGAASSDRLADHTEMYRITNK
jgi:3-hydroxyisobutyrate dehydrogenase